MLSFFYQLLLHLYTLALLPKFLWQRKGRPLATWLGKGFPRLGSKKGLRIWIHAVSVGEAKAAGPLIRRFRALYPDCEILLSSITSTGHAEVKRSLPEVDYPVYLPLDLFYVIKPLVRRIAPDLFLLCETDYWLTLLQEIKKGGGRVAVVNGKFSAQTTRRLQNLRPFANALLAQVDHFCLQDETYRKRTVSLGVRDERLTVTGNLKYESPPPTLSKGKLEAFAKELKIQGPVITVGSTHPKEEAMILTALCPLDGVKILLVPRHPHRFDEVADLLKQEGVNYGRYSQRESLTGDERVILVDTMGILSACYQLADLSVVAGSFVPGIGGHNILEPLWCGSPCLFGPYMEDQPGMVKLVKAHKAAVQVTPKGLRKAAKKILAEGGSSLVAAGDHLLASIEGATERTWQALLELLEKSEGDRVDSLSVHVHRGRLLTGERRR